MLELFRKFHMTQRFVILVALAGAVSVLIAVLLWTQQADMQVLFAKLSPEDANTIIERLDELKVSHEIAGGGTTVLVPSSQVHDLRLKLAGDGLPAGGGVGFEIFDRSSIGMSDFVQKLNYRRALQGELARTIAQIAEVVRARVHLAMPERRLFATDEERARASVVLSLRGDQALDKSQVRGIVHLVASSVEGLQPADVTVVDGHGRLLSRMSDEGPGHMSGSQLEFQRTFEHDLETRVQTMLERIVGMNKAVVRVSSTLNFRQVEYTDETYDPDSQVVRSEQRTQEKTSEANGHIGGVPGVASNVPGGESAQAESGSTNKSQIKNETFNYEINRRVSRIIEPSGTVQKLSVAVLVDGTYKTAPGAGGGAPLDKQYVPRSEEEMTRIEGIVKKAIGFSAERGDQVEVVNVQFGFGEDAPVGAEAESASTLVRDWARYVRYGVGATLFLLVLFFVARPLVVMLLTAQPGAAGGTPSLPAPLSQVEALIGNVPRATVLDHAKTDPQSTALVVKQWLKGTA